MSASLSIPNPTELPARGVATAERLMHSALDLIAERDSTVGAMVHIDAAAALEEAAAADRALRTSGPASDLHGLPVAVKDVIDVAGVPTSCGSRHPSYTPTDDAAIVRALRRAGAVVLGKSATHEFACGTTTPGTTNPAAPDRIAGGSSGGSAAAVAAGYCRVAVGTDTGGSVRMPAALCGVAGLKPTLGRLPTEGVVPLSTSIDHVGLFASDVAYLALAWRALAPPSPVEPGLSTGAPIRIGIAPPGWTGPLAPEVETRFETAIGVLRSSGHDVSVVALPSMDTVRPTLLRTAHAEAALFHAERLARAPELFSASVRAALEAGAAVTDAERGLAAEERGRLSRAWLDTLNPTHGVDVVVTPTVPVTAPAIGAEEHRWPDSVEPIGSLLARLTAVHDLTGLPALSVPAATDGLPVGVQLIGRPHTEELLLAVGAVVER